MTEIEWWDYDDAGELADAVSGDIAFLIEQALDARGNAVVAFPGGSTPLAAFDRLAKAKLNWKNVTILTTDERLVPLTDTLSNVRMLAERFLPVGARVMPLSGGKVLEPKAAARIANDTIADVHWPLDLVWLGVGSDGHTASIFRGPDYEEALDSPHRIVGVMPDPLPKDAPVARLSLSRSAILAARAITLTVTGDAKRALIEESIEEGASSPYPIGRVLADASQAIDIHWAP